MKKKVIALSLVTVATLAFAASPSHSELQSQINKLQAQLNSMSSSSSSSFDSKVARLEKTVSKIRAHDAGDNIKWDVDFRTSVDRITYTHADGTKSKNNGLLTNRLWLGMKFAPSENVSFYGRLSYLKAYGAEVDNSQRSASPNNDADFDWITNENAQGNNTLNVKQAYWLYRNNTFLGADMPWSASIGRRPSTDGLLANFREDQKRQSALAHTVNVEFDGASFKWNLEKVTPLTGSWIKLCMGRGITNAKSRFKSDGTDYATSTNQEANSNMVGFIFVPYDDGQYSIHTNYAHANNLIGFANMADAGANNFTSFGSITYLTAAFVADGIGDEINDFLDNTKFFVSYAQSKTSPDAGNAMLGSPDDETGHSTWIGVQMPGISEGDRFGLEWNKGSKYWRSMTYGEDTMIGSKVATRGTALEAYYHKPLTKALSLSVRYTKIDYDYTGSNGFFGSYGKPTAIADAGNTAIKKAEDIRAYIRYRF